MPEATNSMEAELRALAAELDTGAPPADLAGAVLLRIRTEPVPAAPSAAAERVRRARSWLRARWRAVLAALVALLAGLSLAPPVRATVAEWFGFHGVVVTQQPGPAPTSAPPPPVGTRQVTLAQARVLVGFQPRLPSALGAPTGVEVSADRRVLSLTWGDDRGGVVRIDQFNGEVEPRFWKSVRGEVQFADVRLDPAIWFAVPHELVVLLPDGTHHREPSRLVGPTLVWQSRGLTMRLEGKQILPEALAIAESVR